jgi:Predicted membrane protein
LKKASLMFAGIMAFFSGIYAIVSGHDGYLDKMTNSPIAMLLLYLGAGISGILVLPLILTKNKWLAILVAVIMVLTGILAFIIGFPAIGGHLKDFAHAP